MTKLKKNGPLLVMCSMSLHLRTTLRVGPNSYLLILVYGSYFTYV